MVTADKEDRHRPQVDYRRLLLAASFPVAALLLQILFWEYFRPFAWILFYPAIFFSSWAGGKRTGIAATVLSALAVWWFFVPFPHSFRMQEPAQLLSISIFTAMGVLFSFTHEHLREALRKEAAAVSLANAAKANLEEQVRTRTEDLSKTVELLRESEAKYRRTLDSMLEGCQIIGFDWRYRYLNAASEQHNRRPNAELLGRTMMECWPNIKETDAFKPAKKCMEERTVQRYDTEFTFPDGGSGWYRVIVQPSEEGIVIFDEDITERKLAEKELREQEATLRLILESLPVGVWIVDAQGNIVQGNRAGQEIWKGARYVGIDQYGLYKGWWTDSGEVIQPEEWAAARAILKGETVLDEEIDIECFDGTRKTILHSAVPLRDENGRITGAAIINQDITRRKRAEEALFENSRLLEELNVNLEQRIADAVGDLRRKDQLLLQQSRQAAMGEMIGNIAHQWRQPLNTLSLLAQELQMTSRQGNLTESSADGYVRKMLEIIKHMSKTIDDFRYFFRSGVGKETFRAGEIVQKTLTLLEASMAEHGIDIVVEITDDPVIYGYPNEFSQVLLNLISNSRDAFATRGIPDRWVKIRVYSEEKKTVVTVTDNAGGIPEDIINRVFDPYFTTKGPDQGTGIGLFMSKTIIEKNMNGTITVRNVGTGAEFRLELQQAQSPTP